jgi:hypothetical protein
LCFWMLSIVLFLFEIGRWVCMLVSCLFKDVMSTLKVILVS